MKNLIIGLIVGLVVAVPVGAFAAQSHWKDNADYYIDRHQDGKTKCYVVVPHKSGDIGIPAPSISCIGATK